MAKENKVYEALKSRGMETVGVVCFGTYRGWPLLLRPYSGGIYYLDVSTQIDKRDGRRKLIQKSVKEHYGKSISCQNFGSYLRFPVGFNKKLPYEEQFERYMAAIDRALRENGLTPSERCAICGGGSPDSLCVMEGYQPVHGACVRDMAVHTHEKAQENQVNGSYLTGAVGAVLGAVVGIIPSLITTFLIDTIFSLLFALVPLAALWGYRKLNGKMSRGSIVIIILVSLLSVFLMLFISVAYYTMEGTGLSFGGAFALTIATLLNLEGLAYLAGESLIYFFFMALGIWFAWGRLRQTNTNSLHDMKLTQSTVRPNPNVRSAQNPYGDSQG